MTTLPIDNLEWDASIEEGDIPLSSFAIVKVLSGTGHEYLALRATSDLRTWDILGMLHAALIDVEQQSRSEWAPAGEDDDDGA